VASEQEEGLAFTAGEADAGNRLDTWLASKIDGWSRSRLRIVIDAQDVLVNGSPAKPSYRLRQGDEMEVDLTELPAARFEPENIPLDIVFEDDHLAVINKPAGLVVHPGAGVSGGTLANAVAFHFNLENPSGDPRIGIVHRLDKDTSGLIVVAKDDQTAEGLSAEFHDRRVEKSYVALVHGAVASPSGSIDRPIARDRYTRTKMAVSNSGRAAVTLWKVRQRFEKFTLLDVDIRTGRTHQIRVHLASINHPVVGDVTYNAGRDNTIADPTIKRAVVTLGRFFLHAERLAFVHPRTGERLSFHQPLPTELASLLQIL
jgi:23S rRNA pseudouridine1911/1915/1917 synthase